MNKRTYITALILTIIFLVAQLILKYIFPEYFILVVENPVLIKVGNVIMTYPALYFACMATLGILSDYLFFGAVCQTPKLPKTLSGIIIAYNTCLASAYAFCPEILAQYSYVVTSVSLCYLFIVSAIFTNNLRPLAITFTATNIAQILVLLIRNATVLLTEMNILCTTLISLEGLLIAALCFVIFTKNFEKEDDVYGDGQTLVW